jgi:flagellar hook-basal body complex protein FliE
MAMNPFAINAYRTALSQSPGVTGVEKAVAKASVSEPKTSFVDSLKHSLSEVNAQEVKKDQMVESFATGENQNVHELMIQLQKAGLAMNMTSTVRNKVMDMYQSLIKMPF